MRCVILEMKQYLFQHFLLGCLFMTVTRLCCANTNGANACTVVEFNPPPRAILNSTVRLYCGAESCGSYFIDVIFIATGDDMEHSLGGPMITCDASRLCRKSVTIQKFEERYGSVNFYCKLLSASKPAVYSTAKHIKLITSIENFSLLSSSITPNSLTINWATPESLTGIPLYNSVAVIQNDTVLITSVTNSTGITFNLSSVNTNPCAPILINITTSASTLPPNTLTFTLQHYFLAPPVITRINYTTERDLNGDATDINIIYTIEELQHCPGSAARAVVAVVMKEEHIFPITTLSETIQQTVTLPAHRVYSISVWLLNRMLRSEQSYVQQISLLLIEGGSLQVKDKAPCVKCHFSHLSRSGDMCHVDISISAIGYYEEETIQLTGQSNPEYCFSVLAPGSHTVTVAINDGGGDGKPHVFKEVVFVQDDAMGTNFGIVIGIPVAVLLLVSISVALVVVTLKLQVCQIVLRRLRRHNTHVRVRSREVINREEYPPEFVQSISETTSDQNTTEITHLPEDNNERFTDDAMLNFGQPHEVSNPEEQDMASRGNFVPGVKAANNDHTEAADHTQQTSITIDETDESELLLNSPPTKEKESSYQSATPSLAANATIAQNELARPEVSSVHSISESCQQEMLSGPPRLCRQVSTHDTGTEDDVVDHQLVMTSDGTVSSLRSMTSGSCTNTVQTRLQIEGTDEIPMSPVKTCVSNETTKSSEPSVATLYQEVKEKQIINISCVRNVPECDNEDQELISGQASPVQQQEANVALTQGSGRIEEPLDAQRNLQEFRALDTLQENKMNTDKGNDFMYKESLSAIADTMKENHTHSDKLDTAQPDLQEITTAPAEVSIQGSGPEEQVMVHHRALHRRTSVTIAPSLDPSSNSEEQTNTKKPIHQNAQEELKADVAHSPEEYTGVVELERSCVPTVTVKSNNEVTKL